MNLFGFLHHRLVTVVTLLMPLRRTLGKWPRLSIPASSVAGDCPESVRCLRIFLFKWQVENANICYFHWIGMSCAVLSCPASRDQSLRGLPLLDGPRRWLRCWSGVPTLQAHTFFYFLSHLSVAIITFWDFSSDAALAQFPKISLRAEAMFHMSQKFNPNSPLFLLSLPSAFMGHRLHCLCGDHPGVSMLLLHLQKMDIKEEKQKEGQRQGQKCHQHEGCHGWSQNGGKGFHYCC